MLLTECNNRLEETSVLVLAVRSPSFGGLLPDRLVKLWSMHILRFYLPVAVLRRASQETRGKKNRTTRGTEGRWDGWAFVAVSVDATPGFSYLTPHACIRHMNICFHKAHGCIDWPGPIRGFILFPLCSNLSDFSLFSLFSDFPPFSFLTFLSFNFTLLFFFLYPLVQLFTLTS